MEKGLRGKPIFDIEKLNAMNRTSYVLLLLVGLFLWTACQSEQRSAQQSIEQMETQLAVGFDAAVAQRLLAQYEDYLKNYPDDKARLNAYRLGMARVSVEMQRYVPAVQYLLQLLKDKPAEQGATAALLLAELYDKHLDQPGSAMTAWQAIVEAYPAEATKLGLASKTATQPAITDRMAEMLMQVTVDSTGNLNFKAANEYVNWAETYAAIAFASPQAPQFLYKAAEVARAVRSFDRALGLYQWLGDAYPDDERAAKALFMKAFTYDEDLDKVEEARKCYQDFLTRYPNDDFADDAALLLENLGKTDEQIMQELQQKTQ